MLGNKRCHLAEAIIVTVCLLGVSEIQLFCFILHWFKTCLVSNTNRARFSLLSNVLIVTWAFIWSVFTINYLRYSFIITQKHTLITFYSRTRKFQWNYLKLSWLILTLNCRNGSFLKHFHLLLAEIALSKLLYYPPKNEHEWKILFKKNPILFGQKKMVRK